MAQKNLKVNLTFTADTKQAQAQLRSLQAELTNLMSNSVLGNNMKYFTAETEHAISAVASLKAQLQAATSINTGKLDLTKLNAGFKASGMTLKQYALQLEQLGPQGTAAFGSVARAITNAEIPAMRLNNLVIKLGQTLSNTLRWMVSSTFLTGITSAVRETVDYMRDLNTSLNNIRIVSGKSTKEMQQFAESANKAAKALKTSTVAYADAALIYYQQGLNNKAVEERTKATIKLANVTGESAKTVSEWMTAIWNNFDNGAHTLEYYADVVAALGAATASSADEIAQGLEKFAAVAETVGLSYEYATTALATVTAETRQSADVVGTAFKTLFARMQDLQLGKTLEDGTDLGKYSAGLQAVGVDIKKVNGDMKDMNIILDEVGAKWQTLSKDQQIALAQSTAGIRQYTQFIALMDNWDTFQVNLQVAETSEGTLTEQQAIFEESWEGSKKKVKASLEDLYDNLLNEDFFINFNNGLSDLIELVGFLIDAMNGLPGLLGLIGTLITRIAAPQIAEGLTNIGLAFQSMTKAGKQAQQDLKNDAWAQFKRLSTDQGTLSGGTRADAAKQESEWQEKLAEKANELSAIDKTRYQTLIDIWRVSSETLAKEQERIELLQQEEQALKRILRVKYGMSTKDVQSIKDTATYALEADNEMEQAEQSTTRQKAAQHIITASQHTVAAALGRDLGDTENADIEAYVTGNGDVPESIKDYEQLATALAKVREEITSMTAVTGKGGETIAEHATKANAALSQVNQEALEGITNIEGLTKEQKQAIQKYVQNIIQSAEATGKSYDKMKKKVKQATNSITKDINSIGKKAPTMGQALTTALQATTSILFAIQSISAAWSQLFEEGVTDFKSLLSFLTSFAMGVGMLVPAFKSSVTAFQQLAEAIVAKSTVSAMDVATTKLQAVSHQKLTAAIRQGTAEEKASRIAKLLGVSVDTAAAIIKEKEAGATWKQAIANNVETETIKKKTAAKILETIADWAGVSATWALVIAFVALVALIAVVAVGISHITKAVNADAIAAKEAAQAAQELADAYKNTKDAYEELKTSISDYTEAQTAIDAMIEGTEEWRDAVQDVNDQVLDLIAKYPELSSYVETLDGGRLSISDEGLSFIQQQEREKVTRLQNMSMYANQKKAETAQALKKTQTLRDSSEYNGHRMEVRGIIDEFVKAMETKGDKALLGLGEALQEIGITSKEAIADIEELIRAEARLGKQRDALSIMTTNNLLLNSGRLQASGYTTNIQNWADEILTNKTDDAKDKNITKLKNRNKEIEIDGEKMSVEELTLQYAKDKYDLDDDQFKMRRVENKKEGKIHFKITSGDEKGRHSVSKEELEEYAKELAKESQVDDTVDLVNNLIDISNTLAKSKQVSDQAIGSWLQHGDLSYLDPEVYAELMADGSAIQAIETFANKNVDLIEAAGKNVTDIKEEWYEALGNYDVELAKFNIVKKTWEDFNATIKAGATELDKSENVLRAYADTLIDTNKALEGNEDLAATAAVAHFRLAEGLSAAREAVAEHLHVLNDADANPLEYAEAIGAVKDALDQAFGVNVSTDLIKGNMSTIQKMLNGSEEDFDTFRGLLFSDWVNNSLVLTDDVKNEVISGFEDLLAELDGQEIGVEIELDNKGLLTGFNEALQNGSTTVEEIKSMFANAGLQFDESLVQTYTMPMVTKSTSVITGTDGNNKPFSYTMSTTNATETAFPWIGSNPPEFKMIDADNIADISTEKYVAVDSSGKELTNQSDAIKDGKFKAGTIVKKIGSGENDESAGLVKAIGDAKVNDLLDYAKDKSKTKVEDKFERYYEITELIDDLNAELDKLNKLEERAFGPKKLALIDARIKKEKALLAAERQRYAEIKENLKVDAAALNGYGLIQDEATGRLTNATAIIRGMEAQVSAGTLTQEAYEDFVDKVEQYTETLNLLEETSLDILDRELSIRDAELERIVEAVEWDIKVNDQDLKRLDFTLRRIEDDAYAAANAIALLGEQTTLAKNKFDVNAQGIVDILKLRGASEEVINNFMTNGDVSGLLGLDISAQDLEQIQTFQDNMIDSYDDMEEAFNGIFEKMDGVFEKINEEFDTLNETLDHASSVLESYQNIIELAGAFTLGITDAMQTKIVDSQLEVAQTSIATTKVQYDKNKEMLAQAREGLAAAQAASDQAQIDKWETSIEKYEEQVRQSEQDWLDALARGQELANERRELAINTALKDFLKQTTGYASMEEWQQAYDQQKQLRELYVADYEKAHALSKLSRKINQSINDTDSLKAKKSLLALEEKINKAKEAGVKMSSYELQNLEREYQIELAKIALEEAQNAKSMVRLRRNAEGGMSYVYTADQSAIDQAQQQYEDAIYASQKANDEWLASSEDGLMKATQTYFERLAIINTTTYESVEEKNRAMNELNEWFLEQQRFYTGQIDTVLLNNSSLYNDHVVTMSGYYDQNSQNFIKMTDELISSSDRFITHFEDTLLARISDGLLGDSDSAKAYYSGLVSVIGDGKTPGTLLGNLQAAQDQWELDTKTNFEQAGLSIEGFKDHVSDYLGEGTEENPGVKKIIDKVVESIETLAKKTDFTEAQKAATDYGSKVAAEMKNAADQIDRVNTGLTLLFGKQPEDPEPEDPTLVDGSDLPQIKTEDGITQPDGEKSENILTSQPMFSTGQLVGYNGYERGIISSVQQTTDKNNNITGFQYQLKGNNFWFNEEDLSIVDRNSFKPGTAVRLKNDYKPYRVASDDGITAQIVDENYNKSSVDRTKLIQYREVWTKSKPYYATIDKGLTIPCFYGHNGVIEQSHGPDYINLHTGQKITIGRQSAKTYIDENGNTSWLFELLMHDGINDTPIYIGTNTLHEILRQEDGFNVKGDFYSPFGAGSIYYWADKFDTGGYTGEWGPEGRLAMLHQKEIVLNAHDTENILSIVDMVRHMAAQLDFNALSMANGLGNLIANTALAIPQTIDQNVHITAEFPNATNKEEIKEAFSDLINLAAQYANRK